MIHDYGHNGDSPEPPADDRPLSDTQADLHEEGKALTDESKDLGEKLAEIIEKRKSHG